ncbi:SAM-dependent methyltransferase [Wenjunlia tyrosinilytica]|uniref:SAM-dependent methyltransferase n=1 Tax=Wenjunlia tyrosinilytica TaxID=1544741 RepID=A0A918DZX8_9ACTN|nr:SAM-dependent methyltransferase [Wenjunlia tyrosinilytica]GGO91223.1 SAM-dependent methyltransferase [Wenjunlia tyrosinilytica]
MIDHTRPNIARVYDAILGGKDNYAADRAVAAQTQRIVPEIRDVARDNRAMLGRAVRYMVKAGIRQLVDLGSGLPTAQNTHEVAQSVASDTRVVYVDNDPVVSAHGRALLAENDRTTVVTADLRRPKAVLDHPDLRAAIDFDRPVGMMLVSVIHYLNDNEDPTGIVRAYTNALAPGSHLFLTHFCAGTPEALALEQALLSGLGTGRFRSTKQIAAYFDGLDLVPPGVVHLPQWRPEGGVRRPLTIAQRLMVGGLARKPA